MQLIKPQNQTKNKNYEKVNTRTHYTPIPIPDDLPPLDKLAFTARAAVQGFKNAVSFPLGSINIWCFGISDRIAAISTATAKGRFGCHWFSIAPETRCGFGNCSIPQHAKLVAQNNLCHLSGRQALRAVVWSDNRGKTAKTANVNGALGALGKIRIQISQRWHGTALTNWNHFALSWHF